jgi:hypothetical protein
MNLTPLFRHDAQGKGSEGEEHVGDAEARPVIKNIRLTDDEEQIECNADKSRGSCSRPVS